MQSKSAIAGLSKEDDGGQCNSPPNEENRVRRQDQRENAGAAAASWQGHSHLDDSILSATTRTNESTSHSRACRRGLQEDGDEGAHSLPLSGQKLNRNEVKLSRAQLEDMKAAAEIVITADEGRRVTPRDSSNPGKREDADCSVSFAKLHESRRTQQDLCSKRAMHTSHSRPRSTDDAWAVAGFDTDEIAGDKRHIQHRSVPLPVSSRGIGKDVSENQKNTNPFRSVTSTNLHESTEAKDKLQLKVRKSRSSPELCDLGAFEVSYVDANDEGNKRVQYRSVPTPIAPISDTRVGAIAVRGPGSIVDDDLESNCRTVDSEVHVAEAMTREEMARDLRQQMRSEMEDELQANIIMADVIEEQPSFWKRRYVRITAILSFLIVVGAVIGAVIATRLHGPYEEPNPEGVTITGLNSGDRFGEHIAMSTDASTLAVVAIDGNYVRVYRQANRTVWNQIGQALSAKKDVEREYPSLIDLNHDGSVLAVARENSDEASKDAGQVEIYRYNGRVWEAVGQTLFGRNASEEHFGSSVSISDDGHTVAVGAELGNPSSDRVDAGYVRVFTYNGTLEQNAGRWLQLGLELEGEVAGDQFGRTMALSSDGRRIAVGAVAMRGGSKKGRVRVFGYSDNDWIQLGQALEGDNVEDEADVVDLSANGTILAIALDGADVGGRNKTGLVRVFRLEGCCTWKQHGRDIIGEAGSFGSEFISLSADGHCLAVGSKDIDSGKGRGNLFQWSNSQWNSIASVSGENPGDSLGTSMAVSGNCSLFAFGAPQRSTAGSPAGYVHVYKVEDLN